MSAAVLEVAYHLCHVHAAVSGDLVHICNEQLHYITSAPLLQHHCDERELLRRHADT